MKRLAFLALAVLALAVLALAGCDLRYAVLGFPEPQVVVAANAPIELAYREAKGGIAILTARVNTMRPPWSSASLPGLSFALYLHGPLIGVRPFS